MQANKKNFYYLILSALTFLLAGCPTFKELDKVVLEPTSIKQDSTSMSKRFQEATPKGQTAVDSAIELAQKNVELLEQTSVLRKKVQDLVAENRQLKDRVAALEPELKQTKKELSEANDLLIEMRIELNNWKADILGFRDEMRDADTAQLEALLRIIKVLGGEVKPEASQEQEQSSNTESPNEQSKPRSKETPILGEPNEQ